MTILMFR